MNRLQLSLLLLIVVSTSYAAEPSDTLKPWTTAKISEVTGLGHHSMHSYFNTTPESPDGRWILFYASTSANGHDGEIRIRERTTGKETVLARNVSCEDAHRVACQQWVSGGKRVVYHNVTKSGEWVVMCIDVKTGEEKLLARGRQLCFGNANLDVVPLYGPHWKPGEHTGLELLNVETGKIEKTGLTAEALQKAYPEWIKMQFGDKPISVFFPLLSPDGSRVMFKVATPAGGDFRSKTASERYGLVVYDLKKSEFLFQGNKWGHPSWRADSQEIIDVAGRLLDGATGKVTKIPNYKIYSGDHPSYSPDSKLYVTDTTADREPYTGKKGDWAVVVGDIKTGEQTILKLFDNSKGAKSWRVSHPHPTFSPDGKRIYFNVSDGEWTRLYVAERGS